MKKRQFVAGVLALGGLVAFALGHWFIGAMFALHVALTLSARLRAELALASTWSQLWLAKALKVDDDVHYYWYTKPAVIDGVEVECPAFGCIKGKFWISFWTPLTLETFPKFAAAVRVNNIWRSEP